MVKEEGKGKRIRKFLGAKGLGGRLGKWARRIMKREKYDEFRSFNCETSCSLLESYLVLIS